MFGALRRDARACFDAGLRAVEPGAALARALARDGDTLVLRDAAGRELARHRGPVCVVGAGKAALGMARAAAARLGAAIANGLVIVPHGDVTEAPGPIRVMTGAHPVPDAAGVVASDALLAVVRAADPATLVLVLVSGGASALLAAPAEGLSLADAQAVTAALLAAGAEITALNAVRKHCSRLTGGRLAAATTSAAGCWGLVLSDVVGDDLASIGSGPTVADPTTFADALAVLARYGVTPPAAVDAHLRRGVAGSVAESPKPGDPRLARAYTRIVGRNADAVAAAAAEARARGYAITLVREPLAGDAAAAGERLAGMVRDLPGRGAVGLVAGGETTVRAHAGGVGGRSQHLAVAAAIHLEGTAAALLAAGTDGIDGPTDAAGGCVDGGTARRARAAGLEPAEALRATDSHRLLAATDDLVVTGPTGTNVADVVVALRARA
jgi:hydroxypyruvate reductase